jgi:hypothetical protein
VDVEIEGKCERLHRITSAAAAAAAAATAALSIMSMRKFHFNSHIKYAEFQV